MQGNEALTGRVAAILFDGNDGYKVFKLTGVSQEGKPMPDCTATGRASSLRKGQAVALTGSWSSRKVGNRTERQFSAKAVMDQGAAKSASDTAEEAEARPLVARLMAKVSEHIDATGHAAMPVDRLIELVGAAGGEIPKAELALEIAIRDGHLASVSIGGEDYVTSDAMSQSEGVVAGTLRRMAKAKPSWNVRTALEDLPAVQTTLNFTLSPSQSEAVGIMLSNRVTVLTGGPGTGKTTIVSTVLHTMLDQDAKVALAAPTGRAAKRMEEQTSFAASTIHRLLGVKPNGGFKHNAANKLEFDLVIVDESSMIDIPLMAALCAALPSKAGLMIVGDADQLPSVGPGQVLADVIDSGLVPVIRLKEVHRQAQGSLVIANSRRMLAGEMPEGIGGEHGADWRFVETANAAETCDTIVRLTTQDLPGQGYGRGDIQVLTPQRPGLAGVDGLNDALKTALNPPRPTLGEHGGWRVGDLVMTTRNDYDREIYNGDIGTLRAISRSGDLTIEFDGVRHVFKANRTAGLVLAYAVTVHKAQGSEYPVVIIPVTGEHGHMLSRRLLHTAQTRCRDLVILVGQRDALRRAISRVDVPRVGSLAARLRA